jgi:hypothetical protein
MRWTVFLGAALVVASLDLGARDGAELRGQLTANETERNEGYFSVAQDTALMVRPGSPLHQWLKDHAGQTIRIVIEPAASDAAR